MRLPDPQAAARAIADFLRAIGHEPTGVLADTPALVAQAWCQDLLDGYAVDPASALREGAQRLDDVPPGLVVIRDLAVTIVCPHHLLPACGSAAVGYLPARRVAGFGAIARALRARTRRLTFQEEAGADVARLLVSELGARGAFCRLQLSHGCLVARGARESTAVVESVALAGSFAEAGPDRDLALAVLGRPVAAGSSAAAGACPAAAPSASPTA